MCVCLILFWPQCVVNVNVNKILKKMNTIFILVCTIGGVSQGIIHLDELCIIINNSNWHIKKKVSGMSMILLLSPTATETFCI